MAGRAHPWRPLPPGCASTTAWWRWHGGHAAAVCLGVGSGGARPGVAVWCGRAWRWQAGSHTAVPCASCPPAVFSGFHSVAYKPGVRCSPKLHSRACCFPRRLVDVIRSPRIAARQYRNHQYCSVSRSLLAVSFCACSAPAVSACRYSFAFWSLSQQCGQRERERE